MERNLPDRAIEVAPATRRPSQHTAQRRADRTIAAPINHHHLARFTGGDTALEMEILELFVAQLPRIVAQLRNATSAQDWYEAAHSLKGSASAVGADRLADLARRAEIAKSDHRQFPIEPLVEAADRVTAYIGRLDS